MTACSICHLVVLIVSFCGPRLSVSLPSLCALSVSALSLSSLFPLSAPAVLLQCLCLLCQPICPISLCVLFLSLVLFLSPSLTPPLSLSPSHLVYLSLLSVSLIPFSLSLSLSLPPTPSSLSLSLCSIRLYPPTPHRFSLCFIRLSPPSSLELPVFCPSLSAMSTYLSTVSLSLSFFLSLSLSPAKFIINNNLGVIIDDKFSWRSHIIGTCKTVSKNLYLLSQL